MFDIMSLLGSCAIARVGGKLVNACKKGAKWTNGFVQPGALA